MNSVQTLSEEVKPAVPDGDGGGAAAGSLAAALDKPGLYLDARTADPLAAVEAALRGRMRRSLVLVDSHKEAAAAEARLRRSLDAKAYPKRTPRVGRAGNCRNYAEVEAAEAVGLAPGMSVCPACEFRKLCRFYREQDQADLAQHAIATAARGSADLLGMTAERDALFVVTESAVPFFRPAQRAAGLVGDVRATLARLADAARQVWYGTRDERPFWKSLADLADQLGARIAAPPGKRGEGFIVAPACDDEPPPAWGASLWSALKQLPGARPQKDVVRLVTAAACGRLGELYGTRDGDAVELAAAGKLSVPDKPVVAFAFERAADLCRATDRIVHTLGELRPPAVPTWQAAAHLTAKGRPKAIADMIRAYAASRGVNRLGVVMHRRAAPAILGELEALMRLADAPKLSVGHWRGDVRHLADCDLIVAVGSPTVPPSSVRLRLLQTEQAEAAARPGRWGALPWEAATAAGETVLMPRRGYADPAWQVAHQAVLETAVRRTLALIGRPAVLLTDERLDGFSVVHRPARLSRRDARILSALRVAVAVRGGDTSARRTPKVLEDIYSSLLALLGSIPPEVSPLTTDVIARLASLKVKSVARRLTVLRAAGFVAWRGRSKGWALPAPDWSPVADPALPPPSPSPKPRDARPAFAAAAAVLAAALAGLVAHCGGRWEGPATALEIMLAGYARRNRVKVLRTWLGSADRIGRAVRRLVTPLQLAGVRVAVRRVRGTRLISLEKIGLEQQRQHSKEVSNVGRPEAT